MGVIGLKLVCFLCLQEIQRTVLKVLFRMVIIIIQNMPLLTHPQTRQWTSWRWIISSQVIQVIGCHEEPQGMQREKKHYVGWTFLGGCVVGSTIKYMSYKIMSYIWNRDQVKGSDLALIWTTIIVVTVKIGSVVISPSGWIVVTHWNWCFILRHHQVKHLICSLLWPTKTKPINEVSSVFSANYTLTNWTSSLLYLPNISFSVIIVIVHMLACWC